MNRPGARKVWSSDAPTAREGEAKGAVRVRIERQGRGGKVVSVVEGLPGHPAAIEEVARTLKSRCGAGGTVKGRAVEVQGDHRDRILSALADMGITAKKAGA